ncbi:hypothetical protein VNI00_006779 [Paramarasmius palmivorus]|uniref:Uncharacterized protein n=1 Tax=Paramarasmius palmivorus TaxID=297713 RepID=A0AAW0D910_9AGAR
MPRVPRHDLRSIFPEVSTPDLQVQELTIEGIITHIPPTYQHHFRHLTRLSIIVPQQTSSAPSGWQSMWSCFQTEKVHLEYLHAKLSDGLTTLDMFLYLASYSGLHELHLSGRPIEMPLAQQARDLLYRDVLRQHSSTLQAFTVSLFVQNWDFVPQHGRALESYGQNLKFLHLCLDFSQTLGPGAANDPWVVLLNAAINLPNLHTLFLTIFDSRNREYSNPNQHHSYLRSIKLPPPAKPRILGTPLLLQKNHIAVGGEKHHWVYELQQVDGGDFAFRLVTSVAPRDSVPKFSLSWF